MKKILYVLILLLVLTSLLVQPVLAAGNSFSVLSDANEVVAGQTITLSVSMSSTEACNAFGLMFSYDSDVFEVTGGKCTASYTQGDDLVALKVFDKSRGFAVSFFEPVVYSGSVGRITLQVKENAPVGVSTISFTTSCKNGNSAVAISCESIDITVSEKTVDTTEATIHTHAYGEDWYNDLSQHWHECDCGERSDVADHVWNNNVCDVCSKEVAVPGQNETPNEEENPATSAPGANATQAQKNEGEDDPSEKNWLFGGLILLGVVVLSGVAYFIFKKK